MSIVGFSPKVIVAASMTLFLFTSPVKGSNSATNDDVGALLQELEQGDPVASRQAARALELEWSKSGSASMNLLLNRGEAALNRSDYRAAVDHLTALTDHAPHFAEGRALRARAWHHLDEPGLALSDLQQVLALNPNHFHALFGLGVTLEQLNRPKLALRAYRLVLNIHPQYEEATEAVSRLTPLVQGESL
jgi:tetratricopeptide (TPR) repeat protein